MPTRQLRRSDGLPRRRHDGGLTVIGAATRRSRNLGFARLDEPDCACGLHIPGTPSVYTFGMRFALDLVWPNRRGALARVDRDVAVRRARAVRRVRTCVCARSVIEANAGRADAFLVAGPVS